MEQAGEAGRARSENQRIYPLLFISVCLPNGFARAGQTRAIASILGTISFALMSLQSKPSANFPESNLVGPTLTFAFSEPLAAAASGGVERALACR
jgi:hypothetical protein